jgi:hypothetical protein
MDLVISNGRLSIRVSEFVGERGTHILPRVQKCNPRQLTNTTHPMRALNHTSTNRREKLSVEHCA